MRNTLSNDWKLVDPDDRLLTRSLFGADDDERTQGSASPQ
jgi:hypothetical protein